MTFRTTLLALLLSTSTTLVAAPLFSMDGLAKLEEPAHEVSHDVFVQLDVAVPFAPTVFPSGDARYISYEVMATNMIPKDYSLIKMEVLDSEENVLHSYLGEELEKSVRLTGRKEVALEGESLVLPAGQRVVFFVFLKLENTPTGLKHRFLFDTPQGEVAFVHDRVVEVKTEQPTLLGAPLSGGNWFCDGAPGASSYHRRTMLCVNGLARVSQRYAIDFEMLTSEGKTYQGDPAVNDNYPCYGQPIFSMSDGKVVKVVDGLPDNTPPEVPALTDIEKAGGNSVIVEVEEGRKYLVYGHMQPGSLRVKEGDWVSRGQPLGKVGNSGNSFEPHLHVHLCDRPSFLGSQGLPFVLREYRLKDGDGQSQERRSEIPLLNQVVEFPQRP